MAVEEVVVQNVDVPPTAGFEFEPLPSEILQRNQALVEKIRGELILAPLTRSVQKGAIFLPLVGSENDPL